MTFEVITAIVTAILALIGLAYGYGYLNARVKSNEKRATKIEECYATVDSKLDIISDKITRIETVIFNGRRKRIGKSN